MAASLTRSIFRDHWKTAKEKLSAVYSEYAWESIVEAVEKMLGCGDPSKGYAEYICPRCHKKKKVPFTCKSRFCTSCGKRYIDEWVNKTVQTIIDVAHRHLVFTIPAVLREVIFKDRFLLKVMMDCAAQTALEALQSKGIDAVPGIIIVVHTFGRDLKFNPHVHMLMTEGGLTSDKRWVDIPFLPYRLLRKKWQYYLLTAIKAVLVQTRETARFIDMLFRDNRNGFYVNGASKMTSARYAARYIGRYVARPALAEYKITTYDGRSVTFWYARHETGKRVYHSIGAIEFIKRLIDHIPVKGFKMVRHYGLYARRTKAIAREVLRRCKRFLQMSFEFMKNRAGALSWRERLLVSFGKDPLLCTTCNEEVLLWRIWHPVYGVIFDLSRDAPASTAYEKEQREKTQNTGAGPRWDGQLCLLPV